MLQTAACVFFRVVYVRRAVFVLNILHTTRSDEFAGQYKIELVYVIELTEGVLRTQNGWILYRRLKLGNSGSVENTTQNGTCVFVKTSFQPDSHFGPRIFPPLRVPSQNEVFWQ